MNARLSRRGKTRSTTQGDPKYTNENAFANKTDTERKCNRGRIVQHGVLTRPGAMKSLNMSKDMPSTWTRCCDSM
jgi:hypothetical protein